MAGLGQFADDIICQQVVVFAQSAVEVLLGERCFAAILVVIVIIVVQAVGIAERL